MGLERPLPPSTSQVSTQNAEGGEDGERLTSVILACGLVYDGRMLQATKIEHAYASILAAAHKYIDTVGAKPNVIHLFVVSDKLSLGCQRRNVPDCAGRIDA